MAQPVISILGRPNVGKSTFFNRLLNQRQSIVDAQEGITRDRIYGDIYWCGYSLQFIDTGGYIPVDKDQFNSAVRDQALMAINESDLVLLMVDGIDGPLSIDEDLSKIVRKSGKPYLLVVNKCDNLKTEILAHQFHGLGFNNPYPISALNGRRTGDLLDAILTKLDLKSPTLSSNKSHGLRMAIVGMPNVGKSSLTNALLQKERTIVTPTAGTTRDAIDAHLKWHGQNIVLVDTAGLRKLSKIKDRIEYYSTVRTKNAINNANVVLVLIDAVKGFGKQDKNIVDEVITKGKGMILIVNKWDLIKKDHQTMKNFKSEISFQFKSIDNYPIIFISTLTKQRIHRVLELAWEVYRKINNKILTKDLNELLKTIINKNPPPSEQGKTIKIKYAAQVSKEPAVISMYTNYPKKIKVPYKRYLENQLRKKFNLKGIPVVISFRRK